MTITNYDNEHEFRTQGQIFRSVCPSRRDPPGGSNMGSPGREPGVCRSGERRDRPARRVEYDSGASVGYELFRSPDTTQPWRSVISLEIRSHIRPAPRVVALNRQAVRPPRVSPGATHVGPASPVQDIRHLAGSIPPGRGTSRLPAGRPCPSSFTDSQIHRFQVLRFQVCRFQVCRFQVHRFQVRRFAGARKERAERPGGSLCPIHRFSSLFTVHYSLFTSTDSPIHLFSVLAPCSRT